MLQKHQLYLNLNIPQYEDSLVNNNRIENSSLKPLEKRKIIKT